MNIGVWEIILFLFLLAPVAVVGAVAVWFLRASKDPKRQMEHNKILHEGMEYPEGERPGPERRKLQQRERQWRERGDGTQHPDDVGDPEGQ